MVSRSAILSPSVLLLGALLLAGCGGGTGTGTGYGPSSAAPPPASSMPASSMPATSPATTSVTVKVADSGLGEILVDGDGMTLYLFTKDTQGANASTCEGACLVNWPPLLGDATAGSGADDGKLGSFERTDGTTQVTYNGWPLYYWVNDTAPGDTTGQGVQGVWFVLDADGNAVEG